MYRENVPGINDIPKYAMPWVRLHAIKDYYDTVAILDEFPKIKGNFNLVPSLMVQLDEYANKNATDNFLELTLKDASLLTEKDKIFLLENFFMANWEHMVFPYPRYNELLQKRGKFVNSNDLKRIQLYFKEQDYRDLQMWFNLSWFDPFWRRADDFIKDMYEKGKDYTENEKHNVIDKQREICGRTISKYKQMQDLGRIEVSVTPFYHPIMPLLYNSDIARFAMPGVNLPTKFSHPEDVRSQVNKAVTYYEQVMGRKPRGMWPSEGSVSEDIIPILIDNGIEWIATDEQILFNTVSRYNVEYKSIGSNLREILYHPYKIEKNNKSINILFRDRTLSDAIGFVYTKWHYKDAVKDFMIKINYIAETIFKNNGDCFIPVILDGENCWEYYANDGEDFLKELYAVLSNDPRIETVTVSDYLKLHSPKHTLKNLWPGSWINANYGIWIGHQEDNTAWELLGKTRNFLINYINAHPDKKDSAAVSQAFEELYIAEGSDWCWWYGDDHSSMQDNMFDYLFRKHLMNIYELLEEKIPDELYLAIKGMVSKKKSTVDPVDLIEPVIDGKLTNYFEWLSAGVCHMGGKGGAMHQVETVISSFYYGFDLNNFYLRIDWKNPELNFEEIEFKLFFLKPSNQEITIKIDNNKIIKEFSLLNKTINKMISMNTIAANKIIEFSIPFTLLGLEVNSHAEFVVIVNKINEDKSVNELERWPYQDTVKFNRPNEDFAAESWSV